MTAPPPDPFDPPTLDAITTLALTSDLATPDRRALLIPDPTLRATLRTPDNPADQLRADLHALTRLPAPDGRRPALAHWLTTAAHLTAHLPATHQFTRWAALAGRPPEAPRLLHRPPEPPEPPPAPYPPLLGPYTDRRLFAGRDADLHRLRQLIDDRPLTCLYAVSGAGKSSLLQAGLLPALREATIPEALHRAPHSPDVAADLIRQLLAPAPPVTDPASFVAALEDIHHLAGRPPVLVLDQFEELWKGDDAPAARAHLGPYLAATARTGPDGATPLCRWLLAYRWEFHPAVDSWLGDVLREARAAGAPVAGLPYDLKAGSRHATWELPVFGTAPSGRHDPGAARSAFHEAITRPLDGTRWHMPPPDADRLAAAFAAAREAQPERPLVPELQVMLARLVEASDDGTLRVPDDVEQGITHALRDHVEQSIRRILPPGPRPVATARSLVLTALHRLVDPEGRRSRSLPRGEIEAVIAAEGGAGEADRIVRALSGEGIRLLTVEPDEDRGECLALSHDRLAEVIAELVEQRAGSTFDPELLELVVFVHRRVELHRHGDRAAVGRDDARFDRLAATPALLWDDARRGWWAAWAAETGRQRRAEAEAAAEAQRRVEEDERRAAAEAAREAAEVARRAEEARQRAEEARQREAAEAAREAAEAARRAEEARQREAERRRVRRWAVVGAFAVLVAFSAAVIGWQRRQIDEQAAQLAAQRAGYDGALAASVPETVLTALGLHQASGLSATEAVDRLPAKPAADMWTLMSETFIVLDPRVDADLRLALARAWAGRVMEGAPQRIERVERFGRLLATVERSRLGGAVPAQVAEARSRVLEAMRVMFPLPAGVKDGLLAGGWVTLPGGEFEIGSPVGEAGRDGDEVLHRVWLSSFWLGEAEVTAGQFRLLVPEHRPEDGDALPARDVSWYGAVAYAAWVGARLPTEAEWEYGSRWQGAGLPLARTRYCAGDDVSDLDRVGWYEGNSGGRVHPVKEKGGCGGLYDQHGNVWEWVTNWYAPYSPAAGGAALVDPSGPPTGGDRVVRGGSFDYVADFARSAERVSWRPSQRVDWIGFRLARPAPSPGLDH